MLRQEMADTRARHHAWTREHGEELPEVANWAWPHPEEATAPARPQGRSQGGKAIAVPRMP